MELRRGRTEAETQNLQMERTERVHRYLLREPDDGLGKCWKIV